MENLKKVVAVQHDGDWFVIPIEQKDDFNELSNLAQGDNYDAHDAFNMLYSPYAAGGDLNNIQLYADI